jgi:hypothetical protein
VTFRRRDYWAIPSEMEPFVVLVVLPVLIGIASELVFRDARKASLAAALGTTSAVCVSVQALDSNAAWTWLAALLVSPLPIAFAVATAMFLYGHLQARRRNEPGPRATWTLNGSALPPDQRSSQASTDRSTRSMRVDDIPSADGDDERLDQPAIAAVAQRPHEGH